MPQQHMPEAPQAWQWPEQSAHGGQRWEPAAGLMPVKVESVNVESDDSSESEMLGVQQPPEKKLKTIDHSDFDICIYSVGETTLNRDVPLREALHEAYPGVGNVDVHIRCNEYKKTQESRPSHCGEHIGNLRAVIGQPKFKVELKRVKKEVTALIEDASRPADDTTITILMFCSQGKHRSVSSTTLLAEAMRRNGYCVIGPDHLSKNKWHKTFCHWCKQCRGMSEDKEELFQLAASYW